MWYDNVCVGTVVEEAAKKRLLARLSESQLEMPRSLRDWLPTLLRLDVGGFVLHHPAWVLTADGSSATLGAPCGGLRYLAACGGVMRSGKHYAEFNLQGFTGHDMTYTGGCELPYPGIVRADYRQLEDRPEDDDCELTDRSAIFALGNVFFDPTTGKCYQSKETDENFYEDDEPYEEYDKDWEGMQRAHAGETFAMLLDLDVGTITAYKTTDKYRAPLVKMGVMAYDVKGPVRWAAVHGNGWRGSSIEITLDKPNGCDCSVPLKQRKAAATRGLTTLPMTGVDRVIYGSNGRIRWTMLSPRLPATMDGAGNPVLEQTPY